MTRRLSILFFLGGVGDALTFNSWNAAFDKSLLGLVVVDSDGEILWGTPWDGIVRAKYLEVADVR